MLEFLEQEVFKRFSNNPLMPKWKVIWQSLNSEMISFCVLPTILLLYFTCILSLMLLDYRRVQLAFGWFEIFDLLAPLIAPLGMHNLKETIQVNQEYRVLQVTIPVSVLFSFFFLSISVHSAPPECVGNIFKTLAGTWDVEKTVLLFILPIPALFTVLAVIGAYSKSRALDVAVVLLICCCIRQVGSTLVPVVLSSITGVMLFSMRFYMCRYPQSVD